MLSEFNIDRDRLMSMLTGDAEAQKLVKEMDEETFHELAEELKEDVLGLVMGNANEVQTKVGVFVSDCVKEYGNLFSVVAFADEVKLAMKNLGITVPGEIEELQDVLVALEFRNKIGMAIREFADGNSKES